MNRLVLFVAVLLAGLVVLLRSAPWRPMEAQAGTQEMPILATQVSPSTSGANLTVYAAASLTNAFKEIGVLYTARTGRQIDFAFGASSMLRTQIEQGAVADVFASADMQQMDSLVVNNLASDPPQVFATNRLVVVMPADNPAGIDELRDLTLPGVKFVTTRPEVPIGRYTLTVLDRLSADPTFGSDFRLRVHANVVSREESVRGVLSKVVLAEADAGIVYLSDVVDSPSGFLTLPIPDPYNVVAPYPITALSDAPHADEARAFVDLVLALEGQAILDHHGFVPVSSTPPGSP